MQMANGYFLLLIPLVAYGLLRKRTHSSLKFSNVEILKQAGFKATSKHKLGKYFITLGAIFLILALARPQLPMQDQAVEEKGIDIGLLLDVSGSMKSVDFRPNRLEVARQTIEDFVKQRIGDRLSFIVFGGSAYTRVPLTLDHQVIQQSLKEVSTESVGEEGTAIGMAISVGVNRLKKSEAVSKVLILVTDGENNAGSISPTTASQIAKEMGIKIYCVGVGSEKTILPVTVFGQTQYQEYEGGLDEKLLQEIANSTDGKYFRAKDEKTLTSVFEEIDSLEKSKFEQDHFQQYHELAFFLIPIGLFLWLLGLYFDHYRYLQIP